MKRLTEILKRCEAATSGPWRTVSAECPECRDGWASVTIYDGKKDNWATQNDLKFTEHARTDLPLVVEALQKAITALDDYAQIDSHYIKALKRPTKIRQYLHLTVDELMHRQKYALTCIAEIEALLGER